MDEKIVKDSQGLAKDLVNDCISRQEAIDATWFEPSYTDPLNVLTEVRDRLKALPPAQPENTRKRTESHACDLISRVAALEQIEAIFPVDPHANECAEGVAIGAALAKQFISTLPPVQSEVAKDTNVLTKDCISRQEVDVPDRKVGKWIPVTNGRGGHECSLCHSYAPSFQTGNEWLTDYCPTCGARMECE